MERYQNFTRILISGEPAPLATVTVYLTGTLTLATIYSDNISTPKANPFTSASDGYFFWYAADGRYDVKISGTGITTPYTLGDILLNNQSASPLTTKGDIYTYSTTNVRLPIGTNGQVLTADSAQTTGNKWATPAVSGWTDAGAVVSPTTNTDAITLASGNQLSAPGAGALSERHGASATAAGASSSAFGNTAQATGANSIAIGHGSAAAGTDSIAIGDTAIVGYGDSIAIGSQAVPLSPGELVIGSPGHPIEDVYIGNGPDSGPAANSPIIYHGNDVSGADKDSDGHFIIASGRATGDADGASIKLQTAWPDGAGSSKQPLVNRYVIWGHDIPMSSASGDPPTNNLFEIALTDGDKFGAELLITIEGDDATPNYYSFTGLYLISAVNKAGTYSKQITLASSSHVESSGTIVIAPVLTNGTNTITVGFQITHTGFALPDSLARYQLRLNTRQDIEFLL